MNKFLIGILVLLPALVIAAIGQPVVAQDGAGGGLLDQLEQDGLGAGGFGEGGFGDSIFGSDDPISWKLKKPAATAAGSKIELELIATMERGWHIYGIDQDPEWGVATTIVVVEVGDLQFDGEISEPEPHEREVGDEYYLEHEGETVFKIPLAIPQEAAAGPRNVSVSVTYQACDAKECLLPKTMTLQTEVMVGTEQGSKEAASATFQADESPVKWTVPVLESVTPGTPFKVIVSAEIERGWHIYGVEMEPENGTPTRFLTADSSPLKVIEVKELTPPYKGFDPLIGANSIKHQRKARFEVTLEYSGDAPLKVGSLPLIVESMSCDAMMCLPEERLGLDIPVGVESSSERGDEAALNQEDDPRVAIFEGGDLQLSATLEAGEKIARGDTVTLRIDGKVTGGKRIPAFRGDIQSETEDQGLLGVILLAISGAFLALVTPCVYPMIPITVSVFTKQAHESRSRVIGLAALFGAGIVVSFTSLGFLLSALLGEEGANFMATNGYVNLAIGVLFIVFGFSLFGYYDIQLPAFIRNRVGGGGGGGGAASVLVMGLVFAVTTFTCVGPIVAALLALAAGEGPGFAAVGMLAFSSTIALPFVLLALFPKMLTGLPRSGGWLSTVKVVLGFIELLAAWKFFSAVATYWRFGHIVNREVIMAIWGLTLAAMALNLIGKLRFPHDSPVKSISMGRGLLLLLTLLGAGSCFYAVTGWRMNENIEAQLLVPSLHQKASLPWKHLDREGDVDFLSELEKVRKEMDSGERPRKPLFLNFTGHT
ncbi:MAG: hypothetical protein CBC13_03480 [Planctomycetia bacterium TMED53]|nr:MAG: hypothetical protein CBC13_03480 [Planctomycetia bacterium TMED53]